MSDCSWDRVCGTKRGAEKELENIRQGENGKNKEICQTRLTQEQNCDRIVCYSELNM